MFTVRVENMSEFELESGVGYKYYRRGLSINSSTGAIILRTKKKDELLLYKFSHQDGSYSQDWIRRCSGTDWMNNYLTDTGDIILQDHHFHTCLFDQYMQLIDCWQCNGHLIACLAGPRTAYKVRRGWGSFAIDIRSQDGEILQLRKLYSKPSVCEDATTGRLVVLDNATKEIEDSYPDTCNISIDIFSQDGKSKRIVMNLLFRIQPTDEPVSSLLAFISVAEDGQVEAPLMK